MRIINRWTLAAVLAMCLLLLTGVSACGTDGRQEGGSPGMENSVQGGKISKLEFSLSAMHYDPNFPVNISQKSGEWFIALGAHDVVQKPFRAEDVDEINRVLLQYKVRKWDGFRGSNPPGVLDGEQFYLSIDYEDVIMTMF